MKRLLLTVFLIICLCSLASAEKTFPGPTGNLNLGIFDVVGYEPAVKSIRPTALPPAAQKAKEDQASVVFPQTFIRDDQNLTWKIDGSTGEIELVNNELPSGLSETMEEAVLKAPTWLQTPLVDRFLTLGTEEAEAFADLILNPEDERYVDEYAFLIAMTAERDLSRDHALSIIEETVRNIYDFDEFLDYVEVVDYGTPGDGDYYTTTQYKALVDGNEETFELPKEIYYKYIVHSKCDHEDLVYKEPSSGSTRDPEDGGVFYRDYFMYDAEGEDSYTTPYFMRHPNVITEAELQNWGDTAESYFSARDIYNIDAIYHENGEPVLVEIAYGAGTAVYTTMNIESAHNDGDSLLLENLLAYGCGDIPLETDKKVVILEESAKISIQDYVEDIMTTTLGYTDVSVVHLTTFLAYTTEELAEIDKIIVLSEGSHDIYEAIATNPEKGHPDLGSWLSGGYKVLEVHMSTPADISDLTFYGGYQVPAPGSNGTDTVTMGGRPLLYDVITQAEYVWDEEVYGGLSGDRSFESDGAMAMRIIGNWAGKNMMDNISEYAGKTGNLSGNVERAVEPARIIWNHFGNCGECQDIWTSVLRTCLIPAMNVSDVNEDHVWNEFYHDGDWYYLQNDWSNAATRIATPGGGQDADDLYDGGGKTTSFIFGWDGNGEIFSVIDHYSYSITLEFNLTDAAGQPVPGAKIWLGSEGYYSGSNNWSFFIFTDENGHAETTLGDSRNYYARVESGAGYWPDASDRHSVQVVTDTDATPGSVFTVDHQMDEFLQGEAIVEEPESFGQYGMHLAFDLKQRFQHLKHAFNLSEFTRFPEMKGVDVYLVSESDMQNARAGTDSYTAYQAWEGVTSFDENIFPPAAKGGDYYVVVSGKTKPESMLTLDLASAESIENTGDDDDDDDNDTADDDDDISGGGDDDDDDGGCCG